MSRPIMFQVYDYTRDYDHGIFEDYQEAEMLADELVANGDRGEIIVAPVDLE